MIVKDPTPQSRHLLPGLVLILLGFFAGTLLEPLAWFENQNFRKEPKAVPVVKKFVTPADEPPAADNGLITLKITLPDTSAATIEKVREQAMARGQIIQGEEDTVPGQVTLDDTTYTAELRIKGDWLDHVRSDKWSLRVRLKDGKLMGMRTFSIQNPSTRGWLWEWVVHEAARFEGLLAPRSTFVNVVVNNQPMGIYFLEEHFSKELIESQGRREGPIVIFDESTAWAAYFQNHVGALNFKPKIPPAVGVSQRPSNAGIRAYGEGRLSSMEGLNRSLITSLEKMEGLQWQLVAQGYGESRLRKMHALQNLEGDTVESLLDVPQWAQAHALLSVFQVWHSLVWHNIRFYYNPVSDRLEPIVYDNMAHTVQGQDPVIFQNNPIVNRLKTSPSYYHGFFQHLNRYASGVWLDSFLAHIGDDFKRYREALDGEKPLQYAFRPEQMEQRIRGQQIYLREMTRVKDPVNFDCMFVTETQAGATGEEVLAGTLQIRAWGTTKMPIVIEGFRRDDGTVVSARAALLDASVAGIRITDEGHVMLPPDQRAVVFAFPASKRLATLSNVAEIKASIRQGVQSSKKRLDRVTALMHLSGGETQEEVLRFRMAEKGEIQAEGRPTLPDLATALKQHPYLKYRVDQDKLTIKPGTHVVQGDLIVPAGYPLHAGPGVVLQFAAEHMLYSESPLIFKGSAKAPVILEPVGDASSFSGILVRDVQAESLWQHVTVRRTNSLTRGGWATTGGITFYHAPVTMRDSRIEGTVAEDGTNIFGTHFLLERVTFSECISDSFDGDFVTGTISGCTFVDGEADGVDFSGSDVTVKDCRFIDLGDKGISVGENTRCTVVGGEIINTSIGIASKDLSETKVEGTHFKNVRGFNFAVYIKKAEYGPSSVVATSVKMEGKAGHIVQTGSSLSLNGKSVATQDVDVGRLYDEKILGN